MMKLPRSWAVTVRRRNGEMLSRSGDFTPWSDRWPFLKAPLLRGPAVLGQMMVLGMRSLFFSSDIAAADEEAAGKTPDDKAGARSAGKIAGSTLSLASLVLVTAVTSGPDGTEDDDAAPASAPDQAPVPAPAEAEPVTGGLKSWELALSIGMAVVMFLVVFKALPLGIAWLAGAAVPALKAPLAESLISGLALAMVFICYLWMMSLIPDIRRVFMYHGAEHEVVHVHEKRLPWSVDNARAQPTEHPRCGTSFLFFVVLTSIVVWSLFPLQVGFFGKLALRLALLPLVVGLSFELIRLSARHRTNPFFRALMAPGLWSQRITTKKPDDSMREVSIRSLELASASHGR